jgi:hypothetical protein
MKIAIWPDGYQCPLTEATEEVSWRGDDYIIRETGYCEACDTTLTLDYNEPFAHCECGTQEWYE